MNPQYTVLKIDLLDSYPLADFFDDHKYTIVAQGEDLDKLLGTAMDGFFHENPDIKSYAQWIETAEDGGYEFELLSGAKKLLRVSSLLISQEVLNAALLMKKYHTGQVRKGDGHPYLEHPLEVAYILWKNKFPPEAVAAGFCHDLLEDTDCQEHEIEDQCGREVLRTVQAVSNDEELSDKADWEKKKSKYVESVRAGGETAIAVCIADKIANLRSFFAQYEKDGPAIWKRFNRGKVKKVWFENEVLQMAKANWHHPLLDELEELIGKLEQTSV